MQVVADARVWQVRVKFGGELMFRVHGTTLVPTGRERRVEITWLAVPERRERRLVDEDALVGDEELRAWLYRQQALGTHFEMGPMPYESAPLDLDDARSSFCAITSCFESGYETEGELPEIDDGGVPEGAIP